MLHKVLKFIFVFLLFIIAACSEEPQILGTSSSSFIENKLKKTDKDTLVIFDI